MSNNNNFNEKSLDELEKDMLSTETSLTNYQEQVKRKCNHKATNRGRLVRLLDTDIDVPERKNATEDTVICTRCERVFEKKMYSKTHLKKDLYDIKSAIEQTKFLSHFDDSDWQAVSDAYRALDKIERFMVYYNDMSKKLGNKDGGKNRGNKPNSKGHLGVRPNMFNDRRY